MKYLKKFKLLESSYNILSDDEWDTHCGKVLITREILGKDIEFTEDEYFEVQNVYPKAKDLIEEIDINDDNLSIIIYKYYDEWYYVNTFCRSTQKLTFYKCDQIKGLLSCLNDIKNKTKGENKL